MYLQHLIKEYAHFAISSFMKLVIQRVLRASVTVEDECISQIGKGLFILVGIKTGDSEKEAVSLAEKVSKLRVMRDENDKMNLNIPSVQGELLVVSQFTLYGDTSGGNRPSFIRAARPEAAEPLYEFFLQKLKGLGLVVKCGKFGAEMKIDAVLDGPVTILMEA